MEFGLLGPLHVHDGTQALSLPATKQRIILAALLLRPGSIVTLDELIDAVWDGEPPQGALITLRNHVMRLRRTLGPEAGGRIRTRAPGYVIEVRPGELDLDLLSSHHAAGRAACRAEQWHLAAEQLNAALRLWRGEPLVDVPSETLRSAHRSHFEQVRLEVLRWRIEADLQQGLHEQLVAELRTLVRDQPLHERFRAQLMLALYRADRQSEALAEYRAARTVLVEELGVEPSAELAELHDQILHGAPTLGLHAAPTLAGTPARPTAVPRNDLPRDVSDFTGREAELSLLLAGPQPGSTATRVAAIDGMPGVGKTALAVHAAHRLAGQYRDGQLFLDLHGHTAGRQPLDPAQALARLLTALGVPESAIPQDVEESAALWRAECDGRSLVIVLDNAADAEQVRPLLPGSSRCQVLVTSRRRLFGLDGVDPLSLDVLEPATATALFVRIAGPARGQEPAAELAEAVALCGRLPLALRVAAARLRSRPAWTVGDLNRRLRAHRDRAEPDTDHREVTAAFALSYEQLEPEQRRMFRLLGLLPGTDTDGAAAAALAACDEDEAVELLELLLDCHLLQQRASDRFGLHDLLRDHARRTVTAEEPPTPRQAAVRRLLDHYRWRAAAAMDVIVPQERFNRPTVEPLGPGFDAVPDAVAWLDAERANLVAAVGLTDFPVHQIDLSTILARYLERGAHYADALTVHTAALTAARERGDRSGEAGTLRFLGLTVMHRGMHEQALAHLQDAVRVYQTLPPSPGLSATLLNIGVVCGRTGRLDEGAEYFARGLASAREVGEPVQEATALLNLGVIRRRQGRFAEALTNLEQALTAKERLGDRVGESIARDNLGVVCRRLGRLDEALEHHRRALELDRECNDRGGEAITLDNLGLVHQRRGELDAALELFQQALELSRTIEERSGETVALGNIGTVSRSQGRLAEALAHHQEALAIARELEFPLVLAEARNNLGETLCAVGSPKEALAEHQAALELAEGCGDPFEAARSHDCLGTAQHSLGDSEAALEHHRRAYADYQRLGVPEAAALLAAGCCAVASSGTAAAESADVADAPDGVG
ncbi:AfsR/SARP family transcriptional regulator [Kitasatospora azatica]|uniref:AfsR/SARP family transcriptional regulator n=1 Tax=Kitasatospora azatica TaxID=58347 RepID=UPI00068EF9CC|nr:tetratricopeptide repeat protein [Kitasatospora azatica]